MNKNSPVYKTVFLGLLLAVSVALSALENMIPPIPSLPPGIKPGLSNIAVMYSLLCMTKKDTAALVLLKSLFVLLTRGAVAGAMSFAGGTASALIMLALLAVFGKKISILMISIAGAVSHNAAQIAVAVFIIGSASVLYYLPVLIIAGVLMGYITGMILKVVIPAVVKISPYNKC